MNMKSLVIAATTAFGVSGAAAQQETFATPADTPLNRCIESALKDQEGSYHAWRLEDKTGFREAFEVNSSNAPGHMIGTRVLLSGNENGPTEMQIRGIHDGTVENDNGDSAIDYAILPNPNDVSHPASTVMVNGDKPWNTSIGDVEAVKSNTIKVLNNIRGCMKPG